MEIELIKNRIKNRNRRRQLYHSQEFEDIKSIEKNLDSLIGQKIDKLLNLNNQIKLENRFKTPKSLSMKRIIDNKYNIPNKKKEIINKRITLGKFIMDYSSKKEINNIKNKNLDRDDNNNEKNSENKRIKKKENSLSFFKRKELANRNTMKQIKKEINNSYHFRLVLNKSDQITIERKLGKRYTLFKTILNYLESNNITLYELLQNNPFQNKPYELSNSYDFLLAIKFKNYNYVTEALQFSKRYLFSFDYFGQTGYHWAAKLGDLKMLKLLLEFGLHHNQKDFKGRTPLYLAALNNHKEICNYLLNNNGNIFLKDKIGLSPADVAGSKELKYYLYEYMAQPFSNPIYKARINSFLKDRDERIKKKKEKDHEEKTKKENIKKLQEVELEQEKNVVNI